jgi:hypothetical protein
LALTAVLLLCLPGLVLPSTWVDVDVTCPVCGTVNTFKVPASFGTYVYQQPSRFQYVFWPATTDMFLYTCRRCHLTAYMHDFADIPADEITALAAMLEREAAIDGAVVPYYEIPMVTRLEIARKVYQVLERDAEFWCELDRIAGYHLAEAGRAVEAHAVRERALERAEAILSKAPPGERKEALVIVGALRFHTGDIPGAERALTAAASLTYAAPHRDSKALDAYLSQLIGDFRAELFPTRDR